MEQSMKQTTEVLLHLAPAEVASLKEGINFFRNKSTGKDYILYKDQNHLKACKNLCKHQGGLFIKDIEDLDGRSVKCTKHNWKLDVSTMKYTNPPGSFCQDELVNVAQVTYLTHACMDLKLGDKRMVFDPWLVGPAFARGWWLLHEPPSDWLERLCRADLIYISHMHSDHLSYPTLQKLSQRRPDVPIYVGDTERPVFWNLKHSGVQLTNINVVPFGAWQQVDKNLRFMILMDGVHPEMDTCIIVEYKGHKILNTVDCTRPNGGRLPVNAALMMSDFAGGASGFPMTFSGGKFTEEWKAQFIKTERKKLLNYKAQLVKDLQPRIYCPFAGYFVESHPSDKYIKETNIKNDPNHPCPGGLTCLSSGLVREGAGGWTGPLREARLEEPCPGSGSGGTSQQPQPLLWRPAFPACALSPHCCPAVSLSKGIVEPPEGTKIYKDSWDFQPYLDALRAAVGDEIFLHPSWIKEYFTWAGFKNYNLVVRMIETDEDFNPFPGGYDYLVDFLDLSFPEERPSREHPYEEVRSRVDVIRHVVRNGLLWDDLYIGFQTRLQRDPDIYHHLFWNHFQIKLPLTPPNWKSFLMHCG
uniref:cytidine monophosphate-N-acetylneuraminic acid hydroxylase n=1 Tax=Ictidomys tridecemlineatus TaxID=43179 RepID=UPI001A9F767D|nr:cytidine monophosphate-N-acetylneuraminic acid hydroxylase [Ictidomys tridecemlineatus]